MKQALAGELSILVDHSVLSLDRVQSFYRTDETRKEKQVPATLSVYCSKRLEEVGYNDRFIPSVPKDLS